VSIAVSAEPRPRVEDGASLTEAARGSDRGDGAALHPLTTKWRQFSELSPIVPEWRDLAARALEPNAFYEPAFALAAAPVFGKEAGAVLVWSGAQPRRLVGLFPACIEKRRYGLKLPILVGFTHPYGPLGVPLVDREAPEPIIASWLAHLGAEPGMPSLAMLPYLPEDGPFGAALAAVLARAGLPFADFRRHQRPILMPCRERSLYVEQSLGRRRHKELRRLWRRLGDAGAVLFSTATEPAAVSAALEDFFALEASGWKGRAGTAAARHEPLRRLVQAAVCDLAAEGKVQIIRILVDGRAIAVSIVLYSGNCAWFWKIAYDETFARFSPGVLLSVALTGELANDSRIARTDSCAASDNPMISHIWRERLAMGDRMIAVRTPSSFLLGRQLETLRGVTVSGAKLVRGIYRDGLKDLSVKLQSLLTSKQPLRE
jgi:hypothetical protein